MPGPNMREFWDARARENAPFFVDNRLDYNDPDLSAFWAAGPGAVDYCLRRAGAPAIEATHDVVEIGCGLGRLTRPLAERARTVRALDVSGEMLRRAREFNPDLDNVEWLHGTGDVLTGVADASADVVISHVVFQHVPDPAITLAYVRDIGRVLRPGGWAAIGISNDPGIHRPLRGMARMRGGLRALAGRAPRQQAHPAWIGSAVSLADLHVAAADGGLDVVSVTGAGTQLCFPLLRRV